MTFADLFTMPTPAICREKAAVTFGKESRSERMLRPWAQWIKDNWEPFLCFCGVVACFAYLLSLDEFHW